MRKILILASVLLVNFICLSTAGDCLKRHSKASKFTPLQHIVEFGKRNKIEGNGCRNLSTSTSADTIKGLHNLLHVRSRANKTEINIKGSSTNNNTFGQQKNVVGSKRSNSVLQKLQVKAETIRMLHTIVEKYFPGGHLTVYQKIKALKILGKLIKLKKEGNNSNIKKLLGTLTAHNHSRGRSSHSDDSKLKSKKAKPEQSRKKDTTINESSHDDIYANIASGPDVPKLPPSVSDKDPDHAHSKIMPVGLRRLEGGGDTIPNAVSRPNDISDDFSDGISSYQTPLGGFQGMGSVYQTGNNFLENRMGLSSMPNLIDGQSYARSRMVYPIMRYPVRGWLNTGRQFYSDDDDYDDDDNYDDDVDEEEEQGSRARSHVDRHRFYDDDDDDDDDDVAGGEEIEYTRRYDRKNKIAGLPNKKKKMVKL